MTNQIGHKDMVDDLNMLTPSVLSRSDTLLGSERKTSMLLMLVAIHNIPYVGDLLPLKSALKVAPNGRVCSC